MANFQVIKTVGEDNPILINNVVDKKPIKLSKGKFVIKEYLVLALIGLPLFIAGGYFLYDGIQCYSYREFVIEDIEWILKGSLMLLFGALFTYGFLYKMFKTLCNKPKIQETYIISKRIIHDYTYIGERRNHKTMYSQCEIKLQHPNDSSKVIKEVVDIERYYDFIPTGKCYVAKMSDNETLLFPANHYKHKK